MVAQVHVVAPELEVGGVDDVRAHHHLQVTAAVAEGAEPELSPSRLRISRPATDTRRPVDVSGGSSPASLRTSARVWVRGYVTG